MKLLLATFFLAISLHCVAGESECLYEYNIHPNVKWTCDPEGARLTLQCALKGPLDPLFQLQWYIASKDSENLEQIKDSLDGYDINTSILESEGDITTDVRSIASTLVTPPISSSLASQCIWCGADFPGMQSILYSSEARLCFGSKPLMPQCVVEGEVFSNTTVVCATQQQPQALLQEEIVSSGSPPPITVDATEATTTESLDTSDITTPEVFQVETALPTDSTTQPPATTTPSTAPPTPATTPSTAPPTIATTQPSTAPPTPDATQPSTAPPTPAATQPSTAPPTPDATQPSTDPSSTARVSTNLPAPTDVTDGATTRAELTSSAPQGSTEGGLFVAIAICVVFIVIIIILVSIVICLFRQWRWKKEKARIDQDENDGADPNSARPSPGPPVIARGYSVDRFQLDPDALFLRALEDPQLLTTRSMLDLTGHQLAPPIPPKPQRMLKASSASALNYRGLGLMHGYNNFTFPEEMPQPNSQDPSIPPPIPVRSKSRDHFYHTLEYSNTDSGLALSSPQHSRQSSSLDSIREQREDEELEGNSQPPPRPQRRQAHPKTQLQAAEVQLEIHPEPQAAAQQEGQFEEEHESESETLFDDPRYVAVQVEYEDSEDSQDEDEGVGQADLQKGVWNSTPSLASTRQSTSSNGATVVGGAGTGDSRRPLRLTHVVGTQIYN